MGKPRRDALRDIVPRTEVPALTNFIGAIIQAEQLGVSISKVLQVQSEQLRIERRQRAEEMAAKARIKMLFPLVGCIFPSLFIVILGPAIILIMINWAAAPPGGGKAWDAAARRRRAKPRAENGPRRAVETAGSLWAKFMGLMGRPSLPAGDGLWLPGEQRDPHDVHALPDRCRVRVQARADGTRRVMSVHRGLRAWTGWCRWSAARTGCWSCRSARSTRRERPWVIGWRSTRGGSSRVADGAWRLCP